MYLGDFAGDSSINFLFPTRNDIGLPTTFAGSPSLVVYKNGSTTETSAGITLTVDFDGVTGQNHVAVDLSADAFYVTQADYTLAVAAGTVDGTSVVGETLATFSIQNRYMRGTDNALSSGSGGILVDHNYGGVDALRYVVQGGVAVGNAEIHAFLTADYNAGNRTQQFRQGDSA